MTGSDAPVSPLIRSALFVADLERSTRFYRALGLTATYYEGTLDAGSVNAVLALPATTVTRCRILKRPDGPNFGMVGLFELTDPAPAPLARDGAGVRAGETALVFYVGDRLEAALGALEALGGRRLADPVLFTMPHASQREVLLRDPDGVLVNLIARAPDRAFQTAPAR
ncbi:MAG: hypothetical protein MI723_12650 [Caulobacterales bacterium]|nr:hypothetical protein [Caulobacterales bacterium]